MKNLVIIVDAIVEAILVSCYIFINCYLYNAHSMLEVVSHELWFGLSRVYHYVSNSTNVRCGNDQPEFH
jgi:hypothetical protein